jgi:hypothetical protein
MCIISGRSRRQVLLQTGTVRVEREDGTPAGDVWAVLTPEEAFELMEALRTGGRTHDRGRAPELSTRRNVIAMKQLPLLA